MKKTLLATVLASSMLASPVVLADHLEKCISAINAQKEGDLVKLEALETNGKAVYAFELVDEKDQEWEFTCNAANGEIIHYEGEVESASDAAFAKMAKLDEAKAIAIATKAVPGEVEEVEFELKADGTPVYEIDIENGDVETKIEVSAVDGSIIETSIEKWEIGVEEDERR